MIHLELATPREADRRRAKGGVLVGRNSDTVSRFGNVLTMSPPLILTKDQAGEIVSAIESALAAN